MNSPNADVPATIIAGPRNPFPGLRPYETAEADWFFGREDQIQDLLSRLRQARFVAVVGASGCGKSSLVRAGIVPVLERGFLVHDGASWRIATLRPGNNPIARLANALLDAGVRIVGDDSDIASQLVQASLRSGSRGVLELFDQPGVPQGTKLLILVDQFEELFRFADRKNPDARHLTDEACVFVNLLLEATLQNDRPIYVMLTMRSENLADCTLFAGLPEAINSGLYLVPRLTRDQLREAIEGPVRQAEGKIANSLVNELLNAIGDDPDQLPVLQHALMRLWSVSVDRGGSGPVSVDDYQSIGGLESALAVHLETLYGELDPKLQSATESLFKELTQIRDDGQPVRRPRRLAELIADTKVDSAELKTVIEHFRHEGCTFLTPAAASAPELNDETVVDISHESLIRLWPRLQKHWLLEEEKSRRLRKMLTEETKRWKEGNEQAAVLLTGARLEEAKEWPSRYHDRLSLDEKRFLDASIARQEREARARFVGRIYYGVVATAVAIALAFAAWHWKSSSDRVAASLAIAEQERQTAAHNARIAEEQRARAEHGEHEAAAVAIREGNLSRAIPLLQGDLLGGKGGQLRDFAWRHLCQLCRGDSVATFRDRTEPYQFLGVAFSADGQMLATAGEDGTVLLLDPSHRERAPISLPKFDQSVQTVEFSPDGRYLACATGNWRTRAEDCKVCLWSLAEKRIVAELWDKEEQEQAKRMKSINVIAFSSDGKFLATASEDSQTRVWNLKGDQISLLPKRQGYERGANDVAFAPGSHMLAVGWGLGHLQLWDLDSADSEKPRLDYSGREISSGITALAFSSDGQTIAVAARHGPILYWDVKRGKFQDPVESGQGTIEWLRFSPDGKQFITAGNNGTIVLWDFATQRQLFRFRGHRDQVFTVAFSPKGRRFASASADGSVKLWDTEHRPGAPRDHEGVVGDLAFSPDGKLLATAAGRFSSSETSGGVYIWNAATRAREAVLSGISGDVNAVSFSPDGHWLVGGGYGKSIVFWDVAERKRISSLALEESVTALAVSPLAATPTLATGGYWGTVTLWSGGANNSWTPHPLTQHPKSVTSIVFSPTDGALMASASADGTVDLWDVAATLRDPKAKPLAILKGHSGPCYVARFSPDGSILATGSHDRTVRLWDIQGRKYAEKDATVLPAYDTSVTSLAFSPDGKSLAGGTGDSKVIIWNVITKLESAVIERVNRGLVSCAAFSPDGGLLVTGGTDQTVEFWDAPDGNDLFEPKKGWVSP